MSQSSPDCAIQAIIPSKSTRKAKPAYDFALYAECNPVERFFNAHQALSRDRNTLVVKIGEQSPRITYVNAM